MDDQDLSIFEDKGAVPDAPEVEEPTPEAEAAPEPETVKTEPEPESATGEQEAPPPEAAPEVPEPTSVPITAMLDEREKRQESQRQLEAAQAEAKRYQQQIDAMKAEQEKKPAPDWFEDPTAAAQYQTQTIQAQIQQQALAQSRFFAEREFGREIVQETYQFFEQNPQLSHQFMSEPSPFHAAVEFYQKQKVFDEIGQDPEAWKAQQLEAMRQELQASQPQQQAPKAPPASLSKAGASGSLNEVAVKAPPGLNRLFNG